jgi:hypothetical protein
LEGFFIWDSKAYEILCPVCILDFLSTPPLGPNRQHGIKRIDPMSAIDAEIGKFVQCAKWIPPMEYKIDQGTQLIRIGGNRSKRKAEDTEGRIIIASTRITPTDSKDATITKARSNINPYCTQRTGIPSDFARLRSKLVTNKSL